MNQTDATPLLEGFEPVTYEQWREAVERDLRGAPFEKKLVTHTDEGIAVQPLYTPRDWQSDGDPSGFPAQSPFTRGRTPLVNTRTGWDIRQEFREPDPKRLNETLLTDLAGGVTSAHLRFDLASRNGIAPSDPAATNLFARDGITATTIDALDAALADVHLQMIGLSIEAGASALPAAAITIALAERRGVPIDELRADFNADPLAVIARDGMIPGGLDNAFSQAADLALWCKRHAPGSRAMRVGSAPYHHAGATAAQDLGFSMATAVAYLRVLSSTDLTLDEAAKQLTFNFAVGCNFFLAGAKLRAARRLWDRVLHACGSTDPTARMRLHVKPSKRVITRRDPWVNILRNTACVFAASVGGAEVVSSVPYDDAIGEPDDTARRLARNTQLILQEECHLHSVVDPAGGSWFIESLTDDLAEKGWAVFQQIESRGGMAEALRTGWIHEQIDSAFKARASRIATRRDAITGVSEFPDIGERRVERKPADTAALRTAAIELENARPNPDERDSAIEKVRSARQHAATNAAIKAATAGASISELARALRHDAKPAEITPIAPHPYAAPFEALRDASDLAEAQGGARPKVFLANLGPLAAHTARASFSRNFFEAGGFEAIASPPLDTPEQAADAFRDSGANIACICSSDEIYAEKAASIAPALINAGARSVILAGNPGDAEQTYRDAGIGRFIFIKCDVLQTLTELLEEEGVLA